MHTEKTYTCYVKKNSDGTMEATIHKPGVFSIKSQACDSTAKWPLGIYILRSGSLKSLLVSCRVSSQVSSIFLRFQVGISLGVFSVLGCIAICAVCLASTVHHIFFKHKLVDHHFMVLSAKVCYIRVRCFQFDNNQLADHLFVHRRIGIIAALHCVTFLQWPTAFSNAIVDTTV